MWGCSPGVVKEPLAGRVMQSLFWATSLWSLVEGEDPEPFQKLIKLLRGSLVMCACFSLSMYPSVYLSIFLSFILSIHLSLHK